MQSAHGRVLMESRNLQRTGHVCKNRTDDLQRVKGLVDREKIISSLRASKRTKSFRGSNSIEPSRDAPNNSGLLCSVLTVTGSLITHHFSQCEIRFQK